MKKIRLKTIGTILLFISLFANTFMNSTPEIVDFYAPIKSFITSLALMFWIMDDCFIDLGEDVDYNLLRNYRLWSFASSVTLILGSVFSYSICTALLLIFSLSSLWVRGKYAQGLQEKTSNKLFIFYLVLIILIIIVSKVWFV